MRKSEKRKYLKLEVGMRKSEGGNQEEGGKVGKRRQRPEVENRKAAGNEFPLTCPDTEPVERQPCQWGKRNTKYNIKPGT
jgi:hypothetical protein